MRAVILRERATAPPVSAVVEVVDDWPEPVDPGPGQVRVGVECSALNHMDLWVARGVPGLDLTYPRISGVDACGRVEAVGPGVDEAWRGRRVTFNAAFPRPDEPRPDWPEVAEPELELIGEHHHGAHRERLLLPVDNLADVGDTDPVVAAASGVVFVTAYSMLLARAELRPGSPVLLTGIGGGVATAALSIARWMACPIAVTSRRPDKLQRARELGADLAILDEGQKWAREVHAWTGGRGVDVVVDTVGEAVFAEAVKCLAPGGAFVTAGATSGRFAKADLARLFWHRLRWIGSTMGNQEEFGEVMALLRAGRVEPVVDSVLPWSEAPRAWDRLEAADQMGKIVLDWRT